MKKIMTKKEVEDAIGYNVESAVQKTKQQVAKDIFKDIENNIRMLVTEKYKFQKLKKKYGVDK